MNLNQPLTGKDEEFCEYWLCFWTVLSDNLMSPKFGEAELAKLITYEMHTRRRPHVLKRLTGRYFKLLRKRNWKWIQSELEGANANSGERN